MRKGKEGKLVFMARALMDNRQGPVSYFRLTESNDMAERDAALELLKQIPGSRRLTVGEDTGNDSRDFEALNITPHVAQKKKVVGDGRSYHVPQELQSESSEGAKVC